MVNDIKVGIALALKAFPDVPVYTETVEQKLSIPCFLIKTVSLTHRNRLAGHFKGIPAFDITYLDDSAYAADEVAEMLPLALSEITAGDHTLYASSLSITKDDDQTVHCTVNYAYTGKISEAVDLMNSMNYSGGTK